MSRNIKTVKCLSKHIGELVKVVALDGEHCLAKVVADEDEGYPILKAPEDFDAKYFWRDDDGTMAHNCAKDYQITKELKCLSSTGKKFKSVKKIKKEPEEKYFSAKELLDSVNNFVKLKSGQVGYLIKRKFGAKEIATVLMKQQEDGYGWNISNNNEQISVELEQKYSCGWNFWDDNDAKDVQVIKVVDDDEEVKEEPSEGPVKNALLDMTVRELLEVLNEIIVSRK